LTIVSLARGAARSTVGLKQSSVRVSVSPRPSVGGRWQPAPAAAGGAAVSPMAARTTRTAASGRNGRLAMVTSSALET
jgi:hypothetical protein